MKDLAVPYDEICAAAVDHGGEHGEGALLAVFLDGRHTVLLTIGFEEATDHVDELFLRHVVAVITDIRVAAVVLAVLRTNARPTRVDKLLWREIGARLVDAPTALLDLMVIGESGRWSAAQSLARTSAAARRRLTVRQPLPTDLAG
jgi:hypothetical protein